MQKPSHRDPSPSLSGRTDSGCIPAEPARRKFLKTGFALCLGVMAFLISTHYGIQYALKTLLVQQAHSTGMDWALHIEARTPTLSDIVESDADSKLRKAPPAIEFMNMVNGMLAVGNIYQVDVINADCYCDISLGTYVAKQSGSNKINDLAHSHDHGSAGHGAAHHGEADHGKAENREPLTKPVRNGIRNVTKAPPKGAIRHVFESTSRHKPRNLFGKKQGRFALDRGFVQHIARSHRHDIILHNAHGPNQPATFAEVYHPVSNGGQLSYILRVMVNLEQEAIRFSTTLYLGAAVVLALLMAAFAYPTAKYLNASKRQRESDQRARFLAHHDVMTNVSNRNAFQESTPRILQSSLTNNRSVALFMFDLDNFKEVNDYYGHEVGDQVICGLADKLKEIAPDGAQVARLGGDEFAVVVGDIDNNTTDLTQILDLPTVLQIPTGENRQPVEATISGGVVSYPRDGTSLEELMRHADLALYAAKSMQGGKLLEYDSQMSMEFYDRLDLREEFRDALNNSEIVPFYQPLVNMNSGRIEGFEALARWDHPKKGILTPYVFEEMLLDRELGALVGTQMLNKITHDMKHWKSTGVFFERVGLNVGEGDLLNPSFALNTISTLSKHGLQPQNLAIEITETCMFGANKEAFITQLNHLRQAGCYIALDDFGTGFSSITQIKELPCSAVKIDKSFVSDVASDRADQAIIKSLLDLGKTLGFSLILEGVETTEQLDLLKSLGCELAQGYYYSRPVPAHEIPELLERHNKTSDKREHIRIVA